MLFKENALSFSRDSNHRTKTYKFNCQISGCNGTISVQSSRLKNHSGKCTRCAQLGIPYMHIYNELKNHKNPKYEFDITFDYFLKIIEYSKCHYCEESLIYNKHSKEWNKHLSRAYQLDRKDNNKGYIIGNIVPCCWECNRLKSDLYNYEEFLIIAKALKTIKASRPS